MRNVFELFLMDENIEKTYILFRANHASNNMWLNIQLI